MFDLNALDILNCRKMATEVSHFSKVDIGKPDWGNDLIEDWIISNLKGRYYLLDRPYVTEDGKLKTSRFAGFEDQKEITYFILACPHLRRNQ
jgi:hypothetical protein